MFYTAADVFPQEDKIARRLGAIADILFRHSRKDFNIRVGDRELRYTDRPQFVIIFDSPGSVRRLLLRHNEYLAAEAFVNQQMDIEGDLIAGLKAKNTLIERARTLRLGEKLKILFILLRL
ncbi:hypothetical protein [Thiohalorhabdus methylotrophus]|uniref:SCP-2 sterol transfer family protein n=1 Tax=Thiohalorhabdus methylotrophus TaxID=3242694 RepID=A0ABV4TUW4_9GAMM